MLPLFVQMEIAQYFVCKNGNINNKIDVVNVVHMLARDVMTFLTLLRNNSKICKKISPR